MFWWKIFNRLLVVLKSTDCRSLFLINRSIAVCFIECKMHNWVYDCITCDDQMKLICHRHSAGRRLMGPPPPSVGSRSICLYWCSGLRRRSCTFYCTWLGCTQGESSRIPHLDLHVLHPCPQQLRWLIPLRLSIATLPDAPAHIWHMSSFKIESKSCKN